MKNIKILWADDEIDLLKIHILFLEEKGYEVVTANNGDLAFELVEKEYFDIIFLDENMPGLSGLETLDLIKKTKPSIPVVMITKSEEEDIMDEAIGSKIADYLIKPVNPKQILLTIKKNVDTKRLITQKTTSAYQTEFSQLGMQINDTSNFNDWTEIYKKLVFWEVELERSNDNTMDEILLFQKDEANAAFVKFIKKNYISWFTNKTDKAPLLPHQLVKEKVFPLLKTHKTALIVIDNLRYDQWKVLQTVISEYYQTEEESLYSSILPTATQFARNAMFAGMMPLDIKKNYPQYWKEESEEGSKNLYEKELLQTQLDRFRLPYKMHYEKIANTQAGYRLLEKLNDILNNDLIAIVYNFVDMLSHARTEMDMIKELAQNEAAYRSLTLTWFEHSSLLEMFKELSTRDIRIVLTTDHGTIRTNTPIKVIGDKTITTNLRYKQGKSLNYKQKEVFEITNPQQIGLPTSNLSSRYIFACNKDFFAYPNNYNHYVKYYKDTFQHGGISLEEMLIPVITLKPKR